MSDLRTVLKLHISNLVYNLVSVRIISLVRCALRHLFFLSWMQVTNIPIFPTKLRFISRQTTLPESTNMSSPPTSPNNTARSSSKLDLKLAYVITVPAIWKDSAKDLTRQAAVSAGIPRDNLELITEPEAAALYCATMCTEVNLSDGDCFLVCDAGGGTVVSPSLIRVSLNRT
jgi:hypothetical protein